MRLAAITVLMALLIAPLAFAQFNNPEPKPAPMPQVEPPPPLPAPMPPVQPKSDLSDSEINELIQTVMAARLTKELGLNDEQTVLMVRRLTDLREQINDVRKQRQEALRDLRAAIKSGKTDAEIQSRLDRLMAVDQQAVDVRRNAYQKAAENLTIAQRAKLYIFFSDFPEEMRRLAQRARERARNLMGPEQGPPPGPPQGPQGPRRPFRGPSQKNSPFGPNQPPVEPPPPPPGPPQPAVGK